MRAAQAEVVNYQGFRRAVEQRDGVYRRLQYPASTCAGWGPATGEDGHTPCPAKGRTVLQRPARWIRDGRMYCGHCKAADEVWRAGGTPSGEGRDPELRDALLSYLAPDGVRTRVRHEVLVAPSGVGRVEVRVDVLAVTGADPATGAGGVLEAFEIKSDADKVARLPRQVAGYEQIGQRCWLVTGPRHHMKLRALVPERWGVLVLDGAELRVDRPAADNPHLSPLAAMSLVIGDQLRQIARRAGPTPRPASRMYVHELREHVVAQLDGAALMREVAAAAIPPTQTR